MRYICIGRISKIFIMVDIVDVVRCLMLVSVCSETPTSRGSCVKTGLR